MVKWMDTCVFSRWSLSPSAVVIRCRASLEDGCALYGRRQGEDIVCHSSQKPAWNVALSTFQQHHHVVPRLMCLRQVMCPSCFSLPQMKNLGLIIELDPEGDKITCPSLGLYSVVEKKSIPPEEVPLPMDPPAWNENPSGFFRISAIICVHWS